MVSAAQAEAIKHEMAMRDKFSFVIADTAEAVIVHEALMSFRNRDGDWPTDVLRAEAADRLLARMDSAIRDLALLRLRESETPAVYAEETPR